MTTSQKQNVKDERINMIHFNEIVQKLWDEKCNNLFKIFKTQKLLLML